MVKEEKKEKKRRKEEKKEDEVLFHFLNLEISTTERRQFRSSPVTIPSIKTEHKIVLS